MEVSTDAQHVHRPQPPGSASSGRRCKMIDGELLLVVSLVQTVLLTVLGIDKTIPVLRQLRLLSQSHLDDND